MRGGCISPDLRIAADYRDERDRSGMNATSYLPRLDEERTCVARMRPALPDGVRVYDQGLANDYPNLFRSTADEQRAAPRPDAPYMR